MALPAKWEECRGGEKAGATEQQQQLKSQDNDLRLVTKSERCNRASCSETSGASFLTQGWKWLPGSRGPLKALLLESLGTATVTPYWKLAQFFTLLTHLESSQPRGGSTGRKKEGSERLRNLSKVTQLKELTELGFEFMLFPLCHVALPRRQKHRSINADLFIFHSSNPFAMINITSTYQLDCIMSFPRGRQPTHAQTHVPSNQITLQWTRNKRAASARLGNFSSKLPKFLNV